MQVYESIRETLTYVGCKIVISVAASLPIKSAYIMMYCRIGIIGDFTWPWLERCSVAAGRRSLHSLPGPCDSHSSRAFCSRPAVILLRSACLIWRLYFDWKRASIVTQPRSPLPFISLHTWPSM